MNFQYTDTHEEIRRAVAALCARLRRRLLARCDARQAYPEEFVEAMTQRRLAGRPDPRGIRRLGPAAAGRLRDPGGDQPLGRQRRVCHAQMYTMASLLNHGSEAQKRKYLPRIADGSLRLQAFGVTEPDAGSNTTEIKTFARSKVPAATSSMARRSGPRATAVAHVPADRAHHAVRGGEEEDRRPDAVPGRHRQGAARR